MEEHEKRWSEHLHARVYAAQVVLHTKLGDSDGESFVLTQAEMRHLLDLLSYESNTVSHDTHTLVPESVYGPLTDLIASFAYQRAL